MSSKKINQLLSEKSIYEMVESLTLFFSIPSNLDALEEAIDTLLDESKKSNKYLKVLSEFISVNRPSLINILYTKLIEREDKELIQKTLLFQLTNVQQFIEVCAYKDNEKMLIFFFEDEDFYLKPHERENLLRSSYSYTNDKYLKLIHDYVLDFAPLKIDTRYSSRYFEHILLSGNVEYFDYLKTKLGIDFYTEKNRHESLDNTFKRTMYTDEFLSHSAQKQISLIEYASPLLTTSAILCYLDKASQYNVNQDVLSEVLDYFLEKKTIEIRDIDTQDLYALPSYLDYYQNIYLKQKEAKHLDSYIKDSPITKNKIKI